MTLSQNSKARKSSIPGTLEYRINGGWGVRIIGGGLEIVRNDSNRGVRIIEGGAWRNRN